ncbi:hypothetical protein [Aurantiacibacter rhizosphaerae]|uniref:HPr kinase/phosphorylase C-terminal domain-containing protein n=1 Tax=Aurantiacibacter rhizosphaerae TaxID=2691582 RepID=A0A844XAI0_9SPHN|nr:hypothetical protein [Aurantiacibacter rhizosphaerae]MWV26966.1 hypothetical protein [Aurantiacibacter rhizosphaerae]
MVFARFSNSIYYPSALPLFESLFRGWRIARRPSVTAEASFLRKLSHRDALGIEVYASEWAQSFVVRFPSSTTFHISISEKTIQIEASRDVTVDQVERLLTDQIAPRILAQLGKLVIHASAVEIAGSAALLVGRSGLGKSTLGASFHQDGERLLGDDAIIISLRDGRWYAEAVYPSLRLRNDSCIQVFGSSNEKDYLESTWKCRLDDRLGVATKPVPLASIFFLEDKPKRLLPRVRALKPSPACMRILEHSFWLDPNDRALAAGRFLIAGQVADHISSFTLDFARDYAILPEVRDAVTASMPNAIMGVDER